MGDALWCSRPNLQAGCIQEVVGSSSLSLFLMFLISWSKRIKKVLTPCSFDYDLEYSAEFSTAFNGLMEEVKLMKVRKPCFASDDLDQAFIFLCCILSFLEETGINTCIMKVVNSQYLLSVVLFGNLITGYT